MFRRAFLLELRKHQKTLFGALLIIVLSFAFTTAGVAMFTQHSVEETLWGIAGFLLLVGVPMLAVIFGAVSGNNLRSEDLRISEEDLPLPPVRRVFAAYAASLLNLGLAMVVLAGIAALVHLSPRLLEGYDYNLLLLSLLPVHALAFLLSYWLKQPLLGAGLALLITGLQVYLFFYTPLLSVRMNLVPSWQFLIALAVAMMVLWRCIEFVSKRIERGEGAGYLRGSFLGVALVMAFGLPLLICSTLVPVPDPINRNAAKGKPSEKDISIHELVSCPPEQMREVFRSYYRLKPDHRFLLAISELRRLITGNSGETATAQFSVDHWRVFDGNTELGTIPEFADFSDVLALETNYAQLLLKRNPLKLDSATPDAALHNQIAGFLAPSVFDGLSKIDQDWKSGKRSLPLIQEAGRALTYLSVQKLDFLGVADIVPARALAVLALARSLGSPMATEEILLSNAMEYASNAQKGATELPAGNPIRVYVMLEDAQLKALARTSPDLMTRYFWMARIGRRENTDHWVAEENQLFPGGGNLSILNTSQWIRSEEQMESRNNDELVMTIPSAVVQEVTKEKNSSGVSDSRSFETTLEKRASANQGFFLDADLFRAYYQACFYSALNRLDHPGEGGSPVADEYARYLKHRLSMQMDGAAHYKDFIADVKATSHLGSTVLKKEFLSTYKTIWLLNDENLIPAMHALVEKMDSRPDDRYFLGANSLYSLLDLSLGQRMLSAYLAAVADQDAQQVAEAALVTGNMDRATQLLRSPGIDPYSAGQALWVWYGKKIEPKRMEEEFDRLIAANPDSWHLYNYYLNHLRETQQYDKASRLLETFIKRTTDPSATGYYHSHVRLAHTYYLMGQTNRGLAAIAPIKDSASGYRETALFLNQQGKKNEAEELAQKVALDDPSVIDQWMPFIEILWRNGEYEKAATEISKHPYLTDSDWKYYIGNTFASVFHDQPLTETLKAAEALKKVGTLGSLSSLENSFVANGQPGIAFEVGSVTNDAKDLKNSFTFLILYKELKAAKGEAEAVKWAIQKRSLLSEIDLEVTAFSQRQYEILWKVIDPTLAKAVEDPIWALRVAVIGLPEYDTPELRKLVEDRYKNKPKTIIYQIGRFMLGQIPESELLKDATNSVCRADISAFIGLKAMNEGRYDDAAEWLRLSMEIGGRSFGRNVAFTMLQQWSQPQLGPWYIKANSL